MGPRFDEVTGIENVRIRAAWFNTGNMVIERGSLFTRLLRG